MAYAACAFNEKPGSRTYDYEIPDGLSLAPGDVVRVPSARGEGFQKVYVVGLKEATEVKPEWIKTIIGKHEEEKTDEQ